MMMKRFLTAITFILTSIFATAQIHEIGIFAGGSNAIADVGQTYYINPNKPALGFVYKWNRSLRHTYRLSYTHASIGASDYKSDAPARIQRDYAFANKINELSVGLEFNFFDFDLHQLGPQTTPYIHTGLSYFNYKDQYILNGITYENDTEKAFAIPITAGIKTRLTTHLILALEVGVRYTFTDNLDGSAPINGDYQHLKFGNLDSKDWYTFTGLTLTYTFGQNPCFCFN